MKAAARHWAIGGGQGDTSEAAEDARRFGAPAEIVAELEGNSGAEELFGVWPENFDIAVAFLAISTQWRAVSIVDAGIHYLGLDYAAAQAGLALTGIELTPLQWNGIRIMEGAAASALNGFRG